MAEAALLGMGGSLRDSDTRSVEWFTPPHVFEALDLTFDLDPAAPEGGVPWIPARDHYEVVAEFPPLDAKLDPPDQEADPDA